MCRVSHLALVDLGADLEPGVLMSAQTITSETTSTTHPHHQSKWTGNRSVEVSVQNPQVALHCRHLHEYQDASTALELITAAVYDASILTCRILLRNMHSTPLA